MIPDSNITDVKISEKNDIATVDITIQYSGDLTEKQIDELKDILSIKMNKIVVPRITIVPIIKTWEREEL